ncbi:MAG: CsgG/HfaB family protein [Candidatus Firestonebacteria bacterium]
MKKVILIILFLHLISDIAFSEVTGKMTLYPDGIMEIVFYNKGKEIAKRIFDKKDNEKIIGKIPDGIVKFYDEDGKLDSEQNYKDGKRNGLLKVYYENGKLYLEQNYKDDKRNGVYKYYDEKGGLDKEGSYKDDKRDGLLKEYYGGIIKRLEREENYKDGKLNGICKYYYSILIVLNYYCFSPPPPDEFPFEDDIFIFKDGHWGFNYNLYLDGDLIVELNYKDNELDGLTKWYGKSGILKKEINYKDGKKNGLVKEYFTNGEIATINTYKNGVKINSKRYNEEGRETMNQNYPYEAVITDDNIEQGLSDTITTSFFKINKFIILERSKMKEILKEQKFQLTGCTKTECAVEIGKILNVRFVVISSISNIFKEFVINIRIINVESSEVVFAEMGKCNSEKEIIETIQKLVETISSKVIEKYPKEESIPIAILDLETKKE